VPSAGCGLQRLGGDLSASAGLVFDDDRHAQLILEPLRQDARDRVRAATRREAHHQLDRLAGLGAGHTKRAESGQGKNGAGQAGHESAAREGHGRLR
jgi:hypothetical protein